MFFGLSTGVELFTDPASAQAVTRVKEAALLYDLLVIEAGMLDVTVGEGGSSSFWLPPDRLTDEHRERARRPIPVGAPFQLGFAPQDGPGVPADPAKMVTAINTEVSRAYVAEYHTGILDELQPLELDWVEAVVVPTSYPESMPIGRAIGRANWEDFTAKDLLRDLNSFERSFVYKAFIHNAAVATAMGAAITVTSLFEPMVVRRGLATDHPGDQALSILVPNVGALTWEAVAEFREHPGCEEARGQLREFERRASAGDAEDAAAYLRTIAQDVTASYMQALHDRRTKIGTELVEEALKTGVSLVPGVGPIAEKAATVTALAADAQRERRSWTSAIFKLNQRLPQRGRV